MQNVDKGALCEALGDETAEVIRVIAEPKEDKVISMETDFETAKVRAILNDLLVKNLVQLDRDRLDTGYCHYRWMRREDKIREYVDDYVEHRIRQLDGMLDEEDAIVFECSCNRVGYGTAIERDFTCPDCEKVYQQVKASKGSRKIRSELKRLSTIRSAS